jgi:hypothetical protein
MCRLLGHQAPELGPYTLLLALHHRLLRRLLTGGLGPRLCLHLDRTGIQGGRLCPGQGLEAFLLDPLPQLGPPRLFLLGSLEILRPDRGPRLRRNLPALLGDPAGLGAKLLPRLTGSF